LVMFSEISIFPSVFISTYLSASGGDRAREPCRPLPARQRGSKEAIEAHESGRNPESLTLRCTRGI
jgi:hypothetical protein